MTPCAAVETPHRFRAVGLDSADSASTRGGLDEDAQRGVSTDGPTPFWGGFRIKSTRLSGWDYTSNGYYFVTICTRNRAPLLGEVRDNSVKLTRTGEIVAEEWLGIAVRRRDVSLDQWVVMPNHVHGIVVIHRDPVVETPQRIERPGWGAEDIRQQRTHHEEEMQRGVSTTSRLQAGSLGAIVGQFKSRSTKRLWRSGFRDFGWQPRFYDHIIRDDRSLDHIRQYIMDNPAMWDSQVAIPENLWM